MTKRLAAALIAVLAIGPWFQVQDALAWDRPAHRFSARTAPDVALVDQSGTTHRFESELAGDRVVVLSFMYTTCRTLCPITNSLLAELQSALDEANRDDVRLLSITLDPVRDDVAALSASASEFDAGPNWYFLGGDQVMRLVRAFEMQPAEIAFHDPVIFVGRADLGLYAQVSGFPEPRQLLHMIGDAGALP